MSMWVIQFDCPEACIVEKPTEAECWLLKDDLGCSPQHVYPVERVVLKREPCLTEGVLRCEIAEVLPHEP